MNVPDVLITLLKREKRFFIATHINPEGDALGSSIALSMALESMGKETVLYDRDPVPEFYRFLPGHDRFTRSISNLKSQISNLILLDCNEPERAGISQLMEHASQTTVVIDHHETERDFGAVRWIDPSAPATGMMVYHLIKGLGVVITGDIATNLYAAIAIDTGTFRYRNTTPEVLRVCAALIDSGADPASIAEAMYETWSEKRFKLLVSVLNTLEIVDGVAFTYATKEMFRETGASPEETENFSNFPRMIGTIKISAFFREMDGGYLKASLRSRGDTNVARIAEMFDGGGHRNAAGYKIKADLRTAKERLLEALRKCK